jgi:type II secretory pathway pseudopilin PulG
MVVIALLAVLVGLLLPALGAARSSGRLMVSLSNLRQILAAEASYRVETRGQIPMRMSRYTNGVGSTWDTFSLGGKNCDGWWAAAADGAYDESAYSRPLNAYVYPEVEIEVPEGYINTGKGSAYPGRSGLWTFAPGRPGDEERARLELPVFRSPGDRFSYQRDDSSPEPSRSSYDDVGTSYHLNMKWRHAPGLPVQSTLRYNEGIRRLRLGADYDPTGKLVWVYDQIGDQIANNDGALPPESRRVYRGEFGHPNRAVMGFYDGRAEYNRMTTGALYDPAGGGGEGILAPYRVGKYTLIFQDGPLPPPSSYQP